jgi:hypothetical protein
MAALYEWQIEQTSHHIMGKRKFTFVRRTGEQQAYLGARID